MMAADNDRTLRNVLEKLELLTGERSDGSRRAVLISELNGAIQDLSDQNAAVKRAVRELSVQFNSSSASIKEEMLVRADENSALAQLITTLKAQVGSNKAQIQETQRALATKTMAMAEHITTLAASVNSNSAGIVEEKRVRVTQDEALSQLITSLTATVNSNNNTLTAAIQTEQTARANGDSANASSIQTLTATVNNQSASITTNSNAIASINGTLSAEWSVQGYIDGSKGGLVLTGVKKADGSGSSWNLVIDANTTINGNLVVQGSIKSLQLGAESATAFRSYGPTGNLYGSNGLQNIFTFSFSVPQSGYAIILATLRWYYTAGARGSYFYIYSDGSQVASGGGGAASFQEFPTLVAPVYLNAGSHYVQLYQNIASDMYCDGATVTVFLGAR